MLPGFAAFVGRLVEKLYNFSFPFNSLMVTVIGNRLLNSVTVGLLRSVALNVLDPMVILKRLLVVSVLLGMLVVSVLFGTELSFLLQAEQPIKTESIKKEEIIECFIVAFLPFN
jgi:formate/nitrite transporter FocA (FNT family)